MSVNNVIIENMLCVYCFDENFRKRDLIMNMSMMNLIKKIALTLCLAATPYWSFGMEKEDSNQSPYRNGADMLNSLEGGANFSKQWRV